MYPVQDGFRQPLYQTPLWTQASGSHGGRSYGPPPPKRQKGNCIITRYPPPPGYRGPAQPQTPYGQPMWQQPPFTIQHQPSYSFSQSYVPANQQGHTTHAVHPHSQPHLPPTPSYSPQNSIQTLQTYTWQEACRVPSTAQHHTATHRRRQSSAYSGPLDGNGEPLPPCSEADEDETLESDYSGECYFARHPDEINPDLSLGQIEWHAPLPTRWALPSTFAEAELEALAPRKTPPPGEESISEYFKRKKRDDAFLSVRQTELWNEIKDDIIFRELPLTSTKLMSLSELHNKYRGRYVDAQNVSRDNSLPPDSQHLQRRAVLNIEMAAFDAGLQRDHNDKRKISAVTSHEHATIGDGATASHGRRKRTISMTSSCDDSRPRSPTKSCRPKPLLPVRDQAQEDVLAALGVTGSPKIVYPTPGPAFGPRPHVADAGPLDRQILPASAHRNSLQEIYPKFATTGHDNGIPETRRSFSDRTPPNKDDDHEATPRAQLRATDSNRKRAFEECEHNSADEDGDLTPKQRHKQQRLAPLSTTNE